MSVSALFSGGNLVPFDHSNHKSNHRGALVLAGGIPIYHGMAGQFPKTMPVTAPGDLTERP